MCTCMCLIYGHHAHAMPCTHHAHTTHTPGLRSQLGGFWVKLAQGASVVSALPEAYGAELSQLQDAMPADPIDLVHATLRAELGPGWRQLVTRLEPVPLGSATIAQVLAAPHRRTCRTTPPHRRTAAPPHLPHSRTAASLHLCISPA